MFQCCLVILSYNHDKMDYFVSTLLRVTQMNDSNNCDIVTLIYFPQSSRL